MRLVLTLVSLLVPIAARQRWREEWLAEIRHGGWRMLGGAIPDAWTLRTLARCEARTACSRPGLFHALDQDIRYALRGLLASPGFVLGVVFSLAIGIGATVTAFTVLNAVTLRPFPGVANQHELVRISLGVREGRSFRPYMGYGELRHAFDTLSGLSAHAEVKLALSANGEVFAADGALVSSNYFAVLGIRPVGRFFTGDEDRTPGTRPVAVISDAAWDRFFGRNRAVLGQPVMVNGTGLTVVGVAPPHFYGVRKTWGRPDVWIPLGMAELTLRDREGRPAGLRDAANVWFDFVGRRKPDVGMEQVQAEASVLAQQFAPSGAAPTAHASRVWLNDPVRSAPSMVAFMVIPMLVLAIACVNAANLMLARAAGQGPDWTVRLALGASRWRVVRQVLTEAMLLASASAALGVLLALWATRVISSYSPVPMPLDALVALFTVAIAVVAALAFSLGPALGMTSTAGRRMAPVPSTAGSARSRSRFLLVAVQAALSLGLLATGAQFTRTVFAGGPKLAPVPDPDRLLLASFDLDPLRFSQEAAYDFYDRLLVRVRSIPGVVVSGLSTPGVAIGTLDEKDPVFERLWLPDSPPEGERNFMAFQVSPGALGAIGAPLLQGRHLSEAEADSLRSVLVNTAFARAFFDGAALGRTFRLGTSATGAQGEVAVVGVVTDFMKRGGQDPPIVYYAAPLGYHPRRMLYIRTDGSGAFSMAALQAAVREIDRRVPIGETATLAQKQAGAGMERKLIARGAATLGVLALVLAAAGLYSVVSYVVSLRRRELGVRLALGAEPSSIVTMIIRQALTPTLLGAAVGACGAAVAGAVIRSGLHGAAAVDPLVFAGAAALMVAVMVIASWIPARQAGHVDPVQVLRAE